jgi:hypothetical protein
MKKIILSLLLVLTTLTTFSQITTPFGLFTGCRPTSIQLDAPPGYASYLWSTGETTQSIDYVLTGTDTAILDTATVELICFDASGNAFPQTPVVVRSIREPKLLTNFNKIYNYNINDSIKSELVLSYLTLPEYVFTFTQTDSKVNGLEVISTYISNNRWCYLNQVNPPLIPGKFYHITIHARVNGNDYCTGNYAEIGIAKDSGVVASLTAIGYNPLDVEIWPNPSKTSFQIVVDSDIKKPVNINIYDVRGRLIYTQYVESLPYYDNINQYINSGLYKVVVSQGTNIKSYNIEKL